MRCMQLIHLHELRKKIIAYIDILGFKKYIEETTQCSNQNDLYRILFKFKDLANTHPLARPDRQSTHFSDLLVISVKIDKRSIIDLINDLNELVHTFISSKLLLRGIILKGNILHDNGIIFGPGLINAYLLEKEKVKFPRIIVEKSIVEEFNLETEAMSNLLSYGGSKKLLSIDPFDNEYFINYFAKYIDHIKLMQPKKGIFTDTFLELIYTGLKNDDAGIRSKYQWMADWHNSYLNSYSSEILKDLEFRNKQYEDLKTKFL